MRSISYVRGFTETWCILMKICKLPVSWFWKKKWKYSLLRQAKLNHTLLRLFLGGPIQSCVLEHHFPSKSHIITEILLKGTLNTINPNLHPRWLPILKIEMSLLCLPPLWWGDILFLSCPSHSLSVQLLWNYWTEFHETW